MVATIENRCITKRKYLKGYMCLFFVTARLEKMWLLHTTHKRVGVQLRLKQDRDVKPRGIPLQGNNNEQAAQIDEFTDINDEHHHLVLETEMASVPVTIANPAQFAAHVSLQVCKSAHLFNRHQTLSPLTSLQKPLPTPAKSIFSSES